MTKYEAVRAKIVEACLDTMEIVEYCGWHDATNHRKCKDCIHVKSALSLSHVLRAIKANKKVSAAINESGRISLSEPVKFTAGTVIPNTYPVHWIGCSYDLTKDDLSLQSPETIDFLFKILCD